MKQSVIFLIFSQFIAISTIGQTNFEKQISFIGHQGSIKVIAFPNKNTMLSGDNQGVVITWNSKTGTIKTINKVMDAGISMINFSENKMKLLVGAENGSIKVLSYPEFKVISEFTSQDYSLPEIRFSLFGNDDNTIYYGTKGGKVFMINIKQGNSEQISNEFQNDCFITDGVKSKDGKYILFSQCHTLKYLDCRLSRVTKTMTYCDEYTNQVRESNSSNWLATWCEDGSFNIWDNMGELVKNWRASSRNGYSLFAISPNDRIIATGNNGSSVKLWDSNSGKLIQELIGHKSNVVDVFAFTSNDTLYTGGEDNIIIRWVTMSDLQNKMARETKVIESIEIHEEKLNLEIWASAQVDGDVVSVIINGIVVFDKILVTKDKKSIEFEFESGKTYDILFFAHNEGSITPNTATFTITGSDIHKEFQVSSSITESAVIRIEYK